MPYFYEPAFWLLAMLGVTMTGISKSGFAGGAGAIAVPLLALIMPIPTAAALMLPLLLVMDAKTIAIYRKTLMDIKPIVPITIAAVVGVAIAGAAMADLSTTILQIFLALFSIAFACWHKLTPLLGRLFGSAYLWGTISGISSTLLHAGGPPITLYFLSAKLEKQQWQAQAAVFFAMINLTKIIPYSLHQTWHKELLLASVLLLPFAFLGIKLGQQLQERLSQQTFITTCRALLATSGVFLLLKLC